MNSRSLILSVMVDRRRAVAVNTLLGAVYVGIALAASSPWVMFAAFLLVAVTIRCITLLLLFASASDGAGKQAALVVGFNLVGGLLFVAALVTGLWWLGRVWLAGVKVIVPLVAVIVAYKSMFPLPAAGSGKSDIA